MKNYKRQIISLCLVLILLFCTLALTGCYIIKSGTMSEIAGTYKLTHYSTNEDEIAANGMALFIVIKPDGTGYYAYRDNDTELYFSELRCRYTQDTEEAGKYSYVELDFRGDGTDWFNLGINVGAHGLNARKPKYKGNLFEGNLEIDYYIDVDFKRVSGATDLAYIRMELGDAKLIPFGATRVDGTYYYSGVEAPGLELVGDGYDPFVYFYTKIDVYSDTGTAYYMLKSDEIAREESFTLSLSVSDDGYDLAVGGLNLDAVVNGSYGRYLLTPYSFELDGTEYVGSIRQYYNGYMSDENIESAIDSDIQNYRNSIE